jgi:FRG domain
VTRIKAATSVLGSQSIPAQFFDERVINQVMHIKTADDLWDWVKQGASSPLKGEARAVPSGQRVVYRGQPDSDFNLSSSLYRLCRDQLGVGVVEGDLAAAELEIIRTMRQEGLGRRMSDVELLMVLQHHGIPTRLIDVSIAPLEALFFAVEKGDAVAGRLFIIEVHDDESRLQLPLATSARLPWASAARGEQQAEGRWTSTVALVDEQPLDPRMRAQQGRFLVGGLNRRYGGRSMRISHREISPALYPEVTSLGINFVQQRRSRHNSSWPATGWSVTIESSWKRDILERLGAEDDSIRPDTMYPPVGEVRRLALSVIRETLSHRSGP